MSVAVHATQNFAIRYVNMPAEYGNSTLKLSTQKYDVQRTDCLQLALSSDGTDYYQPSSVSSMTVLNIIYKLGAVMLDKV